jgi:hypothetical protein
MHLIGRDHEPPVFAGPGSIHIESSTSARFQMFADAPDAVEALERLKRMRENPYEPLNRFRLIAWDYEGTQWNAGWTEPRIRGFPRRGWPLGGAVGSLTTVASDSWVSKDSSVELVFSPKIDLPMQDTLLTVTTVNGEEIERRQSGGRQVVTCLGTEIEFSYKPKDTGLWVRARTANGLPHPYAENWLSEPLRALLGQLYFPRLVARNFGDGTAFITLRPSPRRLRHTGIASLFTSSPFSAPDEFWRLYGDYLTVIARERNEEDAANLSPNEITRFYEEIIQATQGSRWVLAMTLASAAEGLGKLLRGGEGKIDNYFKELVKAGVIVEANQKSWTRLRHAVMHGNLVSPWSSEEDDRRLRDLGDLVHRLTRQLIRTGLAAHSLGEEPPQEET